MKRIKQVIKEVTNSDGSTQWDISVSLRSQVQSGLRIQRWSKGHRSRAEAERAWPKFYSKCLQELIDRETSGSTIGALVDAHDLALLRGEVLEPIGKATAVDRIAILRDRLKPIWNRPAKDVTALEIRGILQKMFDDGLSKSRVKALRSAVNQMYSWGIQSGVLKGLHQSPAMAVKLQAKNQYKQEVLTPKEMRIFLEAARECGHPWYPIWAAALLTGMRSGELHALVWTDVDFDNGVIRVSKSFNGRFKLVKSTKSGMWRIVPINSELRELLLELKSKAVGEHVLPRFQDWDRGEQSRILQTFLYGLGLPKVRFHDLRASACTALLSQGVSTIQIQRIFGWSELKTMQHYVRLAGVDVRGATEGLKLLPDSVVMQKVVSIFP
jgi:integrase